MPYVLEIQIKSHETLKRTVLLLFLMRWWKATCKFSASFLQATRVILQENNVVFCMQLRMWAELIIELIICFSSSS